MPLPLEQDKLALALEQALVLALEQALDRPVPEQQPEVAQQLEVEAALLPLALDKLVPDWGQEVYIDQSKH